MEIKIEQTKDPSEISKLNESVQSIHHRLFPEDFKEYNFNSVTKFFEKILISDDSYAFLAKVDNVPAGYILCFLKVRNENEFQHANKVLYIDQISIRDKFKNHGVGKKLVNKAFELAKQLNVTEIQLDHWVKNEGAGDFFLKLGFEYYNFKMNKKC